MQMQSYLTRDRGQILFLGISYRGDGHILSWQTKGDIPL